VIRIAITEAAYGAIDGRCRAIGAPLLPLNCDRKEQFS
jgi:hypothetical protein